MRVLVQAVGALASLNPHMQGTTSTAHRAAGDGDGGGAGSAGNSTHFRCAAHQCVRVPTGAVKPPNEKWYGTADCDLQCRSTSTCEISIGISNLCPIDVLYVRPLPSLTAPAVSPTQSSTAATKTMSAPLLLLGHTSTTIAEATVIHKATSGRAWRAAAPSRRSTGTILTTPAHTAVPRRRLVLRHHTATAVQTTERASASATKAALCPTT